jgi:hypothetical protein
MNSDNDEFKNLLPKGFLKTGLTMVVIAVVGNVLFWGGLIWLGCYIVKSVFFKH